MRHSLNLLVSFLQAGLSPLNVLPAGSTRRRLVGDGKSTPVELLPDPM